MRRSLSNPTRTRDAESAAHVTAQSPPPSSSGTTKKRTINVSREHRKQEIEHLRRHVFELQSELNRLQRRRDELLRPHLAGDTGEFKTIAPVWELLAKGQFQARKKAEAQTARLKARLATQRQVADELLGLVQRAQQIEQDAFALPLSWSLSGDCSSAQEQLERLPILCAQWFVAFSWHAQVHSTKVRFFESKLVSDDDGETVLDIYANQSFPFPVDQVENAIWSVLQTEHADNDFTYTQNCEVSEDTLVANYATATDNDGKRGAIKGTTVSRRFRNDQGHFLVASHVSASSDGVGGEIARSFVVTEDCWVRIVDACELSGAVTISDSAPALTVLQHVRRSRIRSINTGGAGEDSRSLMDLHVKLVEGELRCGQQSIESLLMLGTNHATDS